MFNEDDLTEEENKDLNIKMMDIYLDPVFKDRLINKNIYKVNDTNYSDILELKEETTINNKHQNDRNQDNKQINNNKNKSSNLNKKTKRD